MLINCKALLIYCHAVIKLHADTPIVEKVVGRSFRWLPLLAREEIVRMFGKTLTIKGLNILAHSASTWFLIPNLLFNKAGWIYFIYKCHFDFNEIIFR